MNKKPYYRALSVLLSVAFLLSAPNVTAKSGNYQTRSFSISNGLSSSYVTSLSSDDYNRVWVGTKNGFNIINNGFVEAHTNLMSGEGKMVKIGNVTAISTHGNKGLIASDRGIILFDDSDLSFSEINLPGQTLSITAMLNNGGIAYLYDKYNSQVLSFDFDAEVLSVVSVLGAGSGYSFEKILKPSDSNDGILYMADDNSGVFEFSIADGRLRSVIRETGGIIAEATTIDSRGLVWVSRPHRGIASYSPQRGYALEKEYESFGPEFFDSTAEDILEIPASGDLVVATNGGGICIIDQIKGEIRTISNNHLRYATSLYASSPYDIMVGTQYNGLCVIRNNDLYVISKSGGYLGNSEIQAMASRIMLTFFGDDNNVIWVGTAGNGIYKYHELNRTIESFPSTVTAQISSICNLDKDRLLFFSQYQGLYTLGKTDGRMQPYQLVDSGSPLRPEGQFPKTDDVILCNATDGSVLIFNLDGKCCRVRDGKQEFFQIVAQGSNETVIKVLPHRFTNVLVCKRRVYGMENQDELWPHTLFSTEEDILSAAIDEDCNIWYVTNSGLFRFTLSNSNIEQFDLGNNTTNFVSILYNYGAVWLAGGDKNLYRYSIADKELAAFTSADGLSMDNDFWSNAIATSVGCYFSGSDGVVCTKNAEPLTPINVLGLNVDCMGISVDGEPIKNNRNLYVIPSDHSQINIRMVVKSPSPTVSDTYRFAFVDRYGKEYYSGLRTDPNIAIGHMPGGKYSLMVSQFGSKGWQDEIEVAVLRCKNHFLSTAVIAGLLLCLLGGFLASLLIKFVGRGKAGAGDAQNGDNIIPDTNVKRDEFASDIRQLLGVPVSIIYNTSRKLVDDRNVSPEVLDSSKKIMRQAERLKGTVDFVLDTMGPDGRHHSAIENVDLNEFIGMNIEELTPTFAEHGVRFDFRPADEKMSLEVDKSKFEIALRALMINVSKNCTPGNVSVNTSMTNTGHVRISLAYINGKSYPSDYDDLFSHEWKDTFRCGFNPDGLILARSAAEMAGGRVSGYRNVDAGGSTFYIDLPVSDNADFAFKDFMDISVKDDDDQVEPIANSTFSTKEHTLLIVDDEVDMREFLKDEYSENFKTIYLAKDGREGLEMVRTKMPSIIVSDVKMPRMNGFDLCKAIKSDIEISHLPVILLTSASEAKNQEMGYKMGADVFIPKPFDTKALFHAIEAQLRNRFEVKKRYFTSPLPEITADQTISAADDAFVLKLNKFIEENLGNPGLDIETLAKEMCISRSTLFNKMNSLIGVTAGKYIKKIRIERAKELMTRTSKSVFDIAIEVGFTESQYFSTVFKQETGETPSQYRARTTAKNSE